MNKPKRSNQGQVLIVAALVIVVMLISTAIYIAEIQKSQLKTQPETGFNLQFYKQGIQHAMQSALANISRGGEVSILQTNIDSFNTFMSETSYDSLFASQVTLLTAGGYHDGVWRIQNQTGTAILSAYASFNLTSSGTKEQTRSVFDLNVSSMVKASGVYSQNGSSIQVQLTCRVFNEGQPALAKNFSVSVEKDGLLNFETWVSIENPVINDHGDGTYVISFEAVVEEPENPVLIWLSCQDQRGITLQTLIAPVLQ